jgi:hypothetical protein
MKRTPDPRHMAVKELLARYWAAECPSSPELPWGPADAGALAQFLRSSPSMDMRQITVMLTNRFNSEDHALGEPVFVWIKYLTRYIDGPLNKYRQPLNPKERGTDGKPKPTRADERNRRAVGATAAALERL